MISAVRGPVRLDLFWPTEPDELLDWMVTLGAVAGVVQFGLTVAGIGFWLTWGDPE